MGMGVRRFADPEDVADFVADVFVAVLASAPPAARRACR
jgi:hypothetical protein